MSANNVEIINKEVVRSAYEYAMRCHVGTNHSYDEKPYETHLSMVAQTGIQFLNHIKEADREIVISACWLHDVIEDCRENFNSVKKNTNEKVAEIVFLCTALRGRTRKERYRDEFYDAIRPNALAVYVKLCDRIANVEYSRKSGSNMYTVYYSENKRFLEKLEIEESFYEPMRDHLLSLFEHLDNI